MLASSPDDKKDLDILKSSSTKKDSNTPTPEIWMGVKEGLTKAKLAIAAKDLDKAEELLREILEFAPAEPRPWHILAAVLNRKGETEEARKCLKRTLKIQAIHIELNPELLISKRIAKLLWAQEDSTAALNMLAELILQHPDDEELQSLQQTWTAL